MKTNKIDGMQVVTSDATTIGEVNGTEVDTKKWRLTNLYVELDNEAAVKLDLKKPIIGHVTICIPVEKIDAIGMKKQPKQVCNRGTGFRFVFLELLNGGGDFI